MVDASNFFPVSHRGWRRWRNRAHLASSLIWIQRLSYRVNKVCLEVFCLMALILPTTPLSTKLLKNKEAGFICSFCVTDLDKLMILQKEKLNFTLSRKFLLKGCCGWETNLGSLDAPILSLSIAATWTTRLPCLPLAEESFWQLTITHFDKLFFVQSNTFD